MTDVPKIVDNGDGTFTPEVQLKANPTIDIGDVQIKAGTETIGSVLIAGGGSAAAAFSTAQVALTAAAKVVLAANTARRFAEVKNTDTSISIYLGKDGSLTAANGHLVKAGEAFGIDGYAGPVWAIPASGTPTVTAIEW